MLSTAKRNVLNFFACEVFPSNFQYFHSYSVKMSFKIFNRGLHFHLKIMKTFPKEVGHTATRDTVEKVLKTQSGMFVAWHPEPDFPYEFTKPLEIVDRSNPSLLKETAINTAMEAFKSQKPELARQELTKLTYTTKHIWFPRARDKKAKKTPMDREYL